MDLTALVQRHHRWLSLFVALVAMLGQATVAFSPLAEGRGGRMASHVESSGRPLHVAQHDEAKCTSCQARSMVGQTARPDLPPIVLGSSAAARIADDVRPRTAGLHLQSSPRAPPVLS